MKKLFILFSILSLILTANTLFAQDKGSIKGKVLVAHDSTNFIGVQVYIVQGDEKKIGTSTDNKGVFHIKPLDPGKYTIYFKFVGYQEYSIVNVAVSDNQITFLKDVYLAEGVDLEAVTVDGDEHKDLIEKNGGNLTKVESKDLKRMPDPGNISDNLKVFSSQFQVNERTNEVNFRGSRAGETAYFIDGVRVDNPNGIPKAAIASIKIYMGGVPARYGDFTGGVVVIETKSHFDWVEEQKQLAIMIAKSIAKNDSIGG